MIKKSKKEIEIELIYNKILKDIELLVGNDVTYLSDLEKIGKKLFGVKFKGVYPSNHIPKLNDLSPYAILNLDTSQQSGSHWIAIAKNKNKNETLIFDSFGRNGRTIIKSLYYSGNGRIINSDLKDSEQTVDQDNCGAKSICFLVVVEKFGWDNAKLI
jgi:NDP-sugar pyrophosphorylase family protein